MALLPEEKEKLEKIIFFIDLEGEREYNKSRRI